jgi:hypothetical protein
MKTGIGKQFSVIGAFILALCPLQAPAQPYAIDWFTIDGGGGSSAGGVYSVSGTIGQPDAGISSGGNYTLTGGFWGGEFQGPVPRLSVTLSEGNAVLHWPSSASGWVLLVKDSAAPETAWSLVPQAPVQVGNEFTVTILASTRARFYQLWLP